MRKTIFFFIFFLCLLRLSALEQFDKKTIDNELKKPGVKLVAVDFYMDGCPPCEEAIGKWKELQKKYGKRGFKLFVVYYSKDKSCSLPENWIPDRVICDKDESIAKHKYWKVKDYPQTFVFNWMHERTSYDKIKEVENEVQSFFDKDAPRVYVDQLDENGNYINASLYNMVRYELETNSKFEIVPTEEEQKELARLGKRFNEEQYEDGIKCKPGKAIPANSILKIKKTWNQLILTVYLLEEKCPSANGKSTWRDEDPEKSVREAVGNLMQKYELEREQQDYKNMETYRPYKKEGIAFMAVGAAVVVGTVVGFHVAAERKYDKYQKMARIDTAIDAYDNGISKEKYNKNAKNLRNEAIVLRGLEIAGGVAGGAVFITGIALTAIKRKREVKDEKVSFLNNFAVSPDGFYASLGFEF